MPTRRRYLQSVGAGLAVGLAGCLSVPQSSLELDPLAPTILDEHATAQFQGGLTNRGYVEESIPDAVRVDWSMPVNTGDHTAAKSTPVAVPDGDVVVAGDTGSVHRVGPDGTVRWTADADPTARGIHGTPAIANETVYVGAYDGAMYAFDLATGERRWKAAIGDAIGSSPVYFRGNCFIAVEYADPSGSVAAVDAASGDLRWIDRRPTDHPHSTLALDRDAGRLVVGSNDDICYAWSFPGLDRAWTFETNGAIKGPVATVEGLAIFGSWDHQVYALDLADGSEVWSFGTGRDVMAGPAVTPDGLVAIGSHDGNVYALDLADGSERWRFETGGFVLGGVTATEAHVLFGSYDDRFYAVDAETGRETWHVEGRGNATSAALVTGDAVYYAERRAGGEEPGRLYRLVAA